MTIADLYAVDGRVPIHDGVGFGSAHASAALETIRECAAKVRGQDLAVCKLDHGPSVVAVTVLGKFAIHSLLSHGDNPIYLFLGILQARSHIQVVSANINLVLVLARIWMSKMRSWLTSWTPISTKIPPD